MKEMITKSIASYGTWVSPITSQALVEHVQTLKNIYLDDGDLYWTEARPEQKGRITFLLNDGGRAVEQLPAQYNNRSTVHEYGGSSLAIHQGYFYFSNYSDQRIYRLQQGETHAVPITPEEKFRYADFAIDSKGEYLYCVREDHRGHGEAVNTLVRIPLATGGVGEVIAEGADFYSNPRLSHDGKRICWLQWNHPNMPWNGTELWVAHIDDELVKHERVAGGKEEAIFQPEWSPEGTLGFISDRSGWWNIYLYDGETSRSLLPMEADFGMAMWEFGYRTYGFIPGGIAYTYEKNGYSYCGTLDFATGVSKQIDLPYTHIECLTVSEDALYFFGGTPAKATSLVELDLATHECKEIRHSQRQIVDDKYISIPEHITFPTTNGAKAYAWYYKPQNPEYSAPRDTLPPLLVMAHGGPVSAAHATLSLKIQYWTSRGFAVLNVNYGGSTGYGRDYRRRLERNWGIVDVDDCCRGAHYLVTQELVDPKRMVINGGSAGGYTTLCALTYKHTFAAGASYYGISDLEMLIRDSHKFEAKDLESLIGPYPATKETYYDRSPIHFTHLLKCPVLFLQGLEDKIVPPNQSEVMYEALKEKGIYTRYLAFEGEQHGFRQAKNIMAAIEAEYEFYATIFNFDGEKR